MPMAKLKLTDEQQKTVDTRNSSILVSAAAGSGKTAVLVERIMSQIMDGENPKDIDEFLVVTFTKAAAAQMREKIADKISKELEKTPDNSHLIKQVTLVNRADITTIDSFCLKLVKENFSSLDIDSSFNIGDSGMMELMKNEVIDAMFEKKYKDKSKDEQCNNFFKLVDIFCNDKEDTYLKDEIFKIYNVSSSYPKPDEWLANAKNALLIEDEAGLMELPWIKEIIKITKNKIKAALDLNSQGLSVCLAEGGPDKNIELAKDDKEQLLKIINAEKYKDLRNALDVKFGRLKVCKGENYDEELVEQFKEIRNSYKELVKECAKSIGTPEELVEEIKEMSEYLIPLIELVEEFSSAFMSMKKQRRLMEFSDIEHMAYNLVCAGYDEEGFAIPTLVGEEIAGRYKEIYIDEYQDSNFLQEDILCSVSGYSRGIYNMFMVGDVKQSIYRFRMARPDLFMSKYNKYQSEGDEIKIELKNNFRSRATVLKSINYFFYQLMGEDLGGIHYDENIALVPSEKYNECDKEVDDDAIKNTLESKTEILIVESKMSDETENDFTDEEKNMKKLELEALVISKKIKELVDGDAPQYIYDEDKKQIRKAQYRDIVVLGRSIKGFGDIIYNALMADGIPAYIEEPKGYFDAIEIRIILSMLSIIDNSYQDIPMAAVLLSPIGNMSENDLAVICNYIAINYSNKLSLYEQCQLYSEEFDNAIATKLKSFLGILEQLKQDKISLSISELIWKTIKDTGYYTYAIAMPAGNKRKANINMLLEKADKFENGYYKGLFNFLRYIEKIKINDVDFGEANILGDEDDVVRIISMHKSKGLEYPIVFVSGLGKQFNMQDSKNNLIVHSDYYLASMLIDNHNRIKKNSNMRQAFRTILKTESIAEELRILYVAMTRAKEKLFLTGCETDIESIQKKMSSLDASEDVLLPYDVRLNERSFMRWIIAATTRNGLVFDGISKDDVINETVISYEDVVLNRSLEGADAITDIAKIEYMIKNETECLDSINKVFEYEYPYSRYVDINSKMSISDIKRMKAHDGMEYEYKEYIKDAPAKHKPDENKGKLTGAQRGTIIHKFMELIDFKALYPYVLEDKVELDAVLEYLERFKENLLNDGIFSDEEVSVIRVNKIAKMLTSPLGTRMIKADYRDELFKEQQFSIGILVDDIYASDEHTVVKVNADDKVIVQGIIDGFFYEDDNIILMDYKTDYADENKLISAYKAQLDYYGSTLEQLTGRKVTEKIIYSFHLDREIKI